MGIYMSKPSKKKLKKAKAFVKELLGDRYKIKKKRKPYVPIGFDTSRIKPTNKDKK